MKDIHIHAGSIGQVINAESVEIREGSVSNNRTRELSGPAVEVALSDLFIELFDSDGLHRFLRLRVDAAMVDELPSPYHSSHACYAAAAAGRLIAFGRVDDDLVSALVDARPACEAEIRDVIDNVRARLSR